VFLPTASTIDSVPDPTRSDLAVLRNWLELVGDRPLRWLFHSRRETPRPLNAVHAWWRNPILVAPEGTLSILETTQPDRPLETGGRRGGA
jgi:hypothetical protein